MSASPEDRSAPLISVVTVTRNLIEAGRQEAIAEALACVQEQSFREIEHVVWDGESIDGTQELLETAIAKIRGAPGHVPIRYVCRADSSLYDAMNQAVELCRGEYIVFLNSDDLLYDADCLSRIQPQLTDHPDFAYCETVFVAEDGSRRHARRLTLKSILQRMSFGHNAMLVKRQVFLDLGGHDLQFRIAGDYDMILRMVQAGYRGRRIQSPLSIFQIGGISADTEKAGREMARCWLKNYAQYCDLSGVTEEEAAQWYKKGHLPLWLSWAVLKKSVGHPQLRRAAVFSFTKTLRRSAEFWRKR